MHADSKWLLWIHPRSIVPMLRTTQTTQVHIGHKGLQEHSGVYQGCVKMIIIK